MSNATMQVTITLNSKFSSQVSQEQKEQVKASRAVDVEKLIREALKAGQFKPSKIRESGKGNLTTSTGALRVTFATCALPEEADGDDSNEGVDLKALGL